MTCLETGPFGTGGGEKNNELSRNRPIRDSRRKKERWTVPKQVQLRQGKKQKMQTCPVLDFY